MKTYTKLQLIAFAVQAFAQNDKANTVHATEDGQVFYDENRANLHAGKGEKKLKVYGISRGEVEQYEALKSKKEAAPVSATKKTETEGNKSGNKGGKKAPATDAKTEGAGTEGAGNEQTEGKGAEGTGSTEGDGTEGDGTEGAGTETEK